MCVLRNRGYPFPMGNVFILYKINLLFNLYYIIFKTYSRRFPTTAEFTSGAPGFAREDNFVFSAV